MLHGTHSIGLNKESEVDLAEKLEGGLQTRLGKLGVQGADVLSKVKFLDREVSILIASKVLGGA